MEWIFIIGAGYDAKASINNSTIYSVSSIGLSNLAGQVDISNCNIYSTRSYGIQNYGDGIYHGSDYAYLKIKNSTITSSSDYAIYNWNATELHIDNCTVESDSSYGICNYTYLYLYGGSTVTGVTGIYNSRFCKNW